MKNIQFPRTGGLSNVNPQSDVKTKGPKRTRIPNFNFRQALNELSNSLVHDAVTKPPVISKYNDTIKDLAKRKYADVRFIDPTGCTPLPEEIAQQPINKVDEASNKYIEQDEQAFA